MSQLRFGVPVLLLSALGAFPAFAAEPFPVPFTVEHQVFDGSLGGAPVESAPVKDTYGGSFLVSERPDGSRMIVDFARREVTEVRTAEGTYWTLSFGRFSDLRRRLREAESTGVPAAPPTRIAAAKPAIRVEEVQESGRSSLRNGLMTTGSVPRRLRASVEGGATLDAWVDPGAPRLTAEGVAALGDFERTVLGAQDGSAGVADLLDAIRNREAGALVVRTRRVVGDGPVAGADAPVVEDVVTRAEPAAALPKALVSIPEGLRRVSSPLEVVVSWAEDEAALRHRGQR